MSLRTKLSSEKYCKYKSVGFAYDETNFGKEPVIDNAYKKNKLTILAMIMCVVVCTLSSCNTKEPGVLWECDVSEFCGLPKNMEQAKTNIDKLDYALLLYAFAKPNKERDAQIRKMTDALVQESLKKDPELECFFNGKKTFYDGTDDSIIAILRAVSSAANTFYVIPTIILRKAPVLLNATTSYWGGRRDNFLPRSGLRYNRGLIEHFPKKEMDHYVDIVFKYAPKIEGTIRYAIYGYALQNYDLLAFNPKEITNRKKTKEECENSDDYRMLKKILEYEKAFEEAKQGLMKYLKASFNMNDKESENVAIRGLVDLIPNEDGCKPPGGP